MQPSDRDNKLLALEQRINDLERELLEVRHDQPNDQSQSSSQFVMGHPSTMPDSTYQLTLTPYVNRAPQIQPNSGVHTKIENGYSFMRYGDIPSLGQKLSSAMSKIGITVGDRIATFMYNNGRHFLIHYTSACMGLVLNALNFRLHPNDLIYMLNHVEDQVVFVDALLLEGFEKIDFKQVKTVKTIIVCGPNESKGNWKTTYLTKLENVNVMDFDDFIATGNSYYSFPDLHESSGCGICFTSGTTGLPKGVCYSHRGSTVHLLASLMTDFLRVSGADCWLPLAPMFHAQAWLIPYHALCLGYKVVLSNQYSDAKTQIDMIVDQGVTIYSGVPTVLQSLREEYSKNPRKYSKIKGVLTRVLTGGSAPPPELVNWYKEELGVNTCQLWGMTEMGPVGTYGTRIQRRIDLKSENSDLSDEELEKQLLFNQMCCGLPLPSVDIKIVDPYNFEKELPWDGQAIGELIVRGPSVCSSYYKTNSSVQKKKFYKGWLITGDLGVRSKTGQLVIKDRSKDMIKSGGEWISSVDMENHIMALKEVKTACVVAVKHIKWMQRPVVIVVLKDGVNASECDLAKVRKHMLIKYPKFWGPDDVLYWKEIPMTGTGKMSKKTIRENLVKMDYKLPSERKKQSKL